MDDLIKDNYEEDKVLPEQENNPSTPPEPNSDEGKDNEDEEFLSTIKVDECALITSLIARKIVMPLVRLAVRLNLSANAVTIIGGVCWVLSLFTIIVAAQLFVAKHHIYSGWFLFFTAFLWVCGYVLDVVDGSLARYYKTSSKRGFYLDYVFHLLFKPGFVVSLGVALSVVYDSCFWLYFAVLALAANWTSAESASEHVLCEEIGKNRLNPLSLPEDVRKKVFLGTTDIKNSAEEKKESFAKMAITLAKEILNYYGQSVFFALAVLVDLLFLIITYMFCEGGPFVWGWRIVSICYFILFAILIIRVPFRIIREYKRIALLDNNEEGNADDNNS